MTSKKSMAEPMPQNRGISKSVFFFAIAMVAVIGFMAGSRQYEIYSAIGQIFGVQSISETVDVSSLQRTFQQLKANYDGPLDRDKLIEGANRGMVEAVGDQHTVFMSEEEARQFDKDLSGNIGGGIGAELSLKGEYPSIVRVLIDTPAEKAGLKAKDIITKVNESDTRGWGAEKTAKAIRGEIGTSVKLQIVRDGDQKELSIVRAEIVNPSVRSEVKDGLGILTISRFDGETAKQAKKAAEDFKRQNIRGVILDLRGNGGGYLSASQEVAGIWLDKKIVVSERRGGKVQDELKSGGNPILGGVPTIVLVDGDSASASEIVAGALQDHGAAKLIGKTTFGKGTVQKIVSLDRGAELKVTIARWYTPNGRNITREGIVPDQEVDLTKEDIEADRDPQLEAATKALR